MDDRPFKHWPNTLPWVYLLCCRYVRTLYAEHFELVGTLKKYAATDSDHFGAYGIGTRPDIHKAVPGHSHQDNAKEKKEWREAPG